MTRFTFLPVLVLVATLGCERQEPHPAGAQSAPPAAPNRDLLAGTPAGDIEEWVAEMRAGLDTVSALVATDRAAAHRKVLGLYLNRQEFLEVYYGLGGRMLPTAGLAQAVDTNEERFHELMRLAEATPPAPESDLKRAIGAVERQLNVVLSEAKSTPHRVRAAASSVS